ncbi:zinc transporter ZIP2-like [Suncus etruscus]|uniref:zinc transporter ZIP2-like n=1 Tax=Suncus etruscus TaxID=109475 RepID=UPI00210FA7F0|nr:zinc transporter ZIP2-like [Suncus etruscus]
MEALLGVKLGCMIGLLAVTLVCGLVPIYIKWFKIDAATGYHRRILSLLGCISAGVFLGAGFMHMTAEALEGIESEIQKLLMQVNRGTSEPQCREAKKGQKQRKKVEAMEPRIWVEQERRFCTVGL